VKPTGRLVAAATLVVILMGASAGLALKGSGADSSLSSAGNIRTMPIRRVPSAIPSGARAAGSGQASTQLGTVVPLDSPAIVRTGSIAISVGEGRLVAAFEAVSRDAESDGGFVADSSSALQDRRAPMATLVVRVPSASLPRLIAAVSSLGKVQDQQLHGQDVSGQLVNLSARITNLQAEQLALRDLEERAGSIPSILEVQNELFSVESDIEQLSAEQASLDNRTSYATLTVHLAVVPIVPASKPRAESTFVRGARLAWRNLVVVAQTIVLGIGWAFPLFGVVALGIGVWRWRRRRGVSTPSPASS